MLVDRKHKNDYYIGLRCCAPSTVGMQYFEFMTIKSELLCGMYTILFNFLFFLFFGKI